MPSTPTPPSREPASRRFAWLAIAVIAGCVLWTVGWFLFAAQIKTHLPAALSEIAGPDAHAECLTADVRGYPFRFGLFCDGFDYENSPRGISARAGAFRSAAQFYRPSHVVAEIDGPLTLTAPGLALSMDWQVLQASVRAELGGINRGSVDGKRVTADVDGAGIAQKMALQAERLTAHARKNGPDLDLAAYGDKLANSLIPPLRADSFALEATLIGKAGLLDAPYPKLLGAAEIRIHRLAAAFEESASVEISGPVSIDETGLISGDIELTLTNEQKLIDLAGQLDPELQRFLKGLAPMITSLDTKPEADGITLPLTLRRGQISLGMFPLGQLPPL